MIKIALAKLTRMRVGMNLTALNVSIKRIDAATVKTTDKPMAARINGRLFIASNSNGYLSI
jgi:hypothetical protein